MCRLDYAATAAGPLTQGLGWSSEFLSLGLARVKLGRLPSQHWGLFRSLISALSPCNMFRNTYFIYPRFDAAVFSPVNL